MRRSRQVVAPILASAAVALLSGCKPDMQRCVDEGNRVVDPNYCKTLQSGSTQTRVMPGHFYRYYYGGGGSYVPGTVVTGGSYAPESGRSYSTTNGTARGGFGSSFSDSAGDGAHAGGEGAGE